MTGTTNHEPMPGKRAAGKTCPYGCCTSVPNHNRTDRKANKRRTRRRAKRTTRGTTHT